MQVPESPGFQIISLKYWTPFSDDNLQNLLSENPNTDRLLQRIK